MRRLALHALALVAALGGAACDGRPRLEVRPRVAPGTHPLAGADAVTLTLIDAAGLPIAARRVPATDDGIALDAPVASGALSVTLTATRGVDTLARGRSCPFTAPPAGVGLVLDVPFQPIGQFAPAADPPRAVDGAALVSVDGALYLVGGVDADGAPLRSSQRYLASTGRLTDGPAPARARNGAVAVELADGTALLLGGAAPDAAVFGAERLVGGRFYDMAALFPADWRAGGAVELVPRVILVAGGSVGGTPRADALLLTVGSGGEATLDPVGPLADARVELTLTALSLGSALAVGGRGATGLTSDAVELFDVDTNAFAPLGPRLHQARTAHTATRLTDGRVLVAGGRGADGVPLATVELVDPARRSVTVGGALATARAGHAATALPDGRVLLVGGVGADGAPLADAEIWDPALGDAGGGVPTGAMATPRATPALALLCDGTLLAVNGAATVEAYAAP